jgi:hypothetical protein
MASTRVLRYIELKTGYADNGPAWIARVRLSRSGRALYFDGKLLKSARGGGIAGNYFDAQTGDEYWVSGVKKDGHERHPSGSGKVAIEAGAVGRVSRGDRQYDARQGVLPCCARLRASRCGGQSCSRERGS